MTTLASKTFACVVSLLIGGFAGYLVGRTSDRVEVTTRPSLNDAPQKLSDGQPVTKRDDEEKRPTGLATQDGDGVAGTSILDEELEQLSVIRSLDHDALIAFMNNSTIAGPNVGWAMTRLAELDPEAAFALVLGNQKFERWIYDLFSTLSRLDPERGITMVEQLPKRLQQSAAIGLLLGVPAMDLDEFMALHERLEHVDMKTTRLAGWADRMMETDPERGWRQLLARGMENALDRENISEYTYVWFLNDPLAALDAMTAMDNPARDTAIALLKSSLGGTNSELVISWLMRQDRALQDDLMPDLLGQYAQVDPNAALNHAANLSGEMRSTAERSIIRNWATADPRASIQWIIENRQLQDQAERLTDAARAFAFHKPIEAIAWATSISEPELREAVLVSIGTTGGQAQAFVRPETSLAAAAAIADPVRRRELSQAAYAAWQARDESEAKKGVRDYFSGEELVEIIAPFNK